MRTYLTSAAALCLATGSAHAGALDRTGQSVDVLFETGRYGEFSLGSISPDVKGVSTRALGATFPAGGQSGDIGVSNFNFGAAYKADLNEVWSYAIILDQPFKAEVEYPAGTGYFAQGSNATFDSFAITTLFQYNFQGGFSVYGGPRLQATEASAKIGFARGYDVEADRDWGLGLVAGVAYERPEIALRVSLTYSSEISHSNDVLESINNGATVFPGSVADFETPQSVNLAFQTGVAEDTIVFGGIRWVDWSDFELSPERYASSLIAGQPLLSYADDTTTYTLGVGRRLNENWSLAASVGYEKNTGSLFTNLGPADGGESIGLAVIYTQGKMKITTGIKYLRIGDTTTAVQGTPSTVFNDNDALAIGVKVGYSF
ncbi:hypothetical protein ROLI_023030 [Roseobacter fucihabitans]|uniref:Membrane protein involved in aromatic hydrocarbon degradation n=1 Tax=Roseobacter fucihabitans TaxID=1537242 RepID=A0ABZ2BT52_9RHOB|nr:hypothetical protein [Roseobacter litoralis]MBC6967997.1 Outer membrane protein transport protein (OMPP1/FadL/TodX) [Roseobacter litoralis]